MATEFGLTDQGFRIKRYDQLFQDYSTRVLQAYPNADLDAPSVFGTFGSIISLGFAELYEVAQSLSGLNDVTNASGLQLDQIGFYKNVFRNTGESDTSFRQRIFASGNTFFTQNSQEERICSALKNIDFVDDAIIRVNETGETQADGTPPNSYTPIIFVDQTADLTDIQKKQIAQALLSNHPLGKRMYAPTSDSGYCQYALNDSCGNCKNINWIQAEKIKGAIDIVYRVFTECNPCAVSESTSYDQQIANYLNSGDNQCTQINPTISVASLYPALLENAPVEILSYKYKFFLTTDTDCTSPFFISSPNVQLKTQEELVNLQAANILPLSTGFNTRYVFIEWDANCFDSSIA